MPNIAIAKQGHKLNCPHDLQLKIARLEEKIVSLEGQLGGVSGHVESLSAEPAVDLAGVAAWDDDEDEAEHVIVEQTPTGAVTIPRIPSPYDDDEVESLR
jgi:hypothetical protein